MLEPAWLGVTPKNIELVCGLWKLDSATELNNLQKDNFDFLSYNSSLYRNYEFISLSTLLYLQLATLSNSQLSLMDS